MQAAKRLQRATTRSLRRVFPTEENLKYAEDVVNFEDVFEIPLAPVVGDALIDTLQQLHVDQDGGGEQEDEGSLGPVMGKLIDI